MPFYAYGLLGALVLVLVIWFVFVAPAERRMHARRMELMKRKIERNDERLKLQGDGPATHAADAPADETGRSGERP